MKIQCVILAMFLIIYVVCIKLMTYGNIFGLEILLSSVTGIVFSASTKFYRIIIVVLIYQGKLNTIEYVSLMSNSNSI